MGFKFIDLFAGIGGTRIAFERAGGTCVMTSEWDRFAMQTYAANFDTDHALFGDIREVDPEALDPFDVLIGGFPCQPFSLHGIAKRRLVGKESGFLDQTQGTLFFDIARILETCRPQAFMLENVKNLVAHDKGNTFRVIRETLEGLGYTLNFEVIEGSGWVPQHRERIYIVGNLDRKISLAHLQRPTLTPQLRSILHPQDGTETPEPPYTDGPLGTVADKYTMSERLFASLQAHAARHAAKGNGYGFGLADINGVSRTLQARYYKDGSEILIPQEGKSTPRRLTPRECARLMGFSDDFVIPVSDTQAYKQFGNSVVVPLVTEIAHRVAASLHSGTVVPFRQRSEEELDEAA